MRNDDKEESPVPTSVLRHVDTRLLDDFTHTRFPYFAPSVLARKYRPPNLIYHFKEYQRPHLTEYFFLCIGVVVPLGGCRLFPGGPC